LVDLNDPQLQAFDLSTPPPPENPVVDVGEAEGNKVGVS
jgi:hypothetical protein